MRNFFSNLNFKKAFSLSENITVLSVIGIIIALTIPNMINSRNVKNDRIAVRKAVMTYQKILERELIKSTGLTSATVLAQKITNNNCADAGKYFNITIKDNNNNCIFTTADGIKWYITKDYALIGLKGLKTAWQNSKINDLKIQANNANNHKVFYITFEVENRQIKMLTDYTPTGGAESVGKTRNFIMGDN